MEELTRNSNATHRILCNYVRTKTKEMTRIYNSGVFPFLHLASTQTEHGKYLDLVHKSQFLLLPPMVNSVILVTFG
jgi:hypothetical protein